MRRRTGGTVTLLLAALVLACATSQVGRRFVEESEDGRERIEGVQLGSVGSAAYLHQGSPWVPLIGLCRKSENGQDAGTFFLASIVLAVEPFGFEHLVATGPAGERILPGQVTRADSRFGIGDRRYTEQIEVALSDDDVRWLVAAGPALELSMEGTRLWILVPPGVPLADAVRAYRDEHVEGAEPPLR
jgi:hypothetical protein